MVRGRKGTYETLLADLAAQGYARARIDGEVHELTDKVDLARYEQHTIEVVVDRLVVRAGLERRLTDSLETALRLADGVAEVQLVRRDGEAVGGADDGEADDTLTFSQHLACPNGHGSFEELAPRNFSFNSPYGACETCDGLGTRFEVDPELIVPNRDLSLADGAITPWASGSSQYFKRLVEAVAEELGADVAAPWSKLTKKQQQAFLHGTGVGKVQVRYKNRYGRVRSYTANFEGVVPYLQRRHSESESDNQREQIEGYMREVPCPACGGARLAPLPAGASRSTATRSPRSATCRSARPPRPSRASPSPSAIASSPSGWSRRSTPAWGSSSTSASTTSASPARPPPSPAARRSGSGWPRRSAPGSSACSTCSTSRRSGCTSATTTA